MTPDGSTAREGHETLKILHPLPRLDRALRALCLITTPFAAASTCGTADTVIEVPPMDAGCPQVVADGGGGVPDPPDGALACASGACNYQSQDGCSAGQACRPWINRDGGADEVRPTCRPVGPVAGGEPCEPWKDDCAAGYFCHGGACRKLCCGGDWSACDEGESCLRQLSVQLMSGTVIDAGVSLCYPVNNCDVFDDSSCADEPGRVCRIVDPTGNVACAPDNNRDIGDPCDAASQCGFGAHCVGGRCVRLCRAEECGEPACPADEGICVHLDRDPDGVGECTPDYAPGAQLPDGG